MAEDRDRDLFAIDKYDLDGECEAQPRLYRKFATKLADAEESLARAEASKKVSAAEIQLKVRKNPGRYGVGRISKEAVEAVVEVSSKYREAVEAVITAQHSVAVLKGYVRTLEHRKTSLEILDRLEARSYYSGVKVGEGSKGRQEEKSKKRVAELVKKNLKKE